MASISINTPGEVLIKKAVIKSANGKYVSILNLIDSFTLTQDINQHWISGEININDGINLNTELPIVGNETLDIDFETPGIDTKSKKVNSSDNASRISTGAIRSDYHKFFIYACSPKKQVKDTVFAYTLYFVSEESIIAYNTRICQTFKGDPFNMIRDIEVNYLSNSKSSKNAINCIDHPVNQFAFISNFWSPTTCINFICQHSIDEKGLPGYIFYENILGVNFQNIDDLIGQPASYKFRKSNFSQDPSKPAQNDLNAAYCNILKLAPKEGFDFFERSDEGYYGGTEMSFDTTTGRFGVNSCNRESLSKLGLNRLNEYISADSEYIQGEAAANLKFIPRQYHTFDGFDDCSKYKLLALREMYFAKLFDYKVTIKVKGLTNYIAGFTAELDVPMSGVRDKGETDNQDKILSGKYLISKVTQIIKDGECYSILDLVKGSTKKSLDPVKVS